MEEEETRFTSLLPLTKADKTLCIKVQDRLSSNVNTQKYAKMCIIGIVIGNPCCRRRETKAYGVLEGNFYRVGSM